MNIKERIVYVAKEQRLSIAEIERNCDIGERSIDKWDKSVPSIEKVSRVANFLGVSIDWLYSSTNSEPQFNADKMKDMASRITNLAQLKCVNVEMLEKQLQWQPGTIQSFYTRMPSIEELMALSQQLHIKIDVILGNSFIEHEIELLTIMEQNILTKLRQMHEHGHKKIIEYIDDLISTHRYSPAEIYEESR